MKLTEELKQKINAYFESRSEEEVKEILKEYGIEVPEKQSVKERPIGDIFEFEGTKLKVVKSKNYSCRGCYFNSERMCTFQNVEVCGACVNEDRSDNNYVVFVKVSE